MRKVIFLCTILLFAANALAENVRFEASTERTVAVNQQFKVIYKLIYEKDRGRNLRVPGVENLQELSGPHEFTSSSISNVNGVVTQEKSSTYTYVFMATKEGEYTIPAASIQVGGTEYKSNEVKITVLPADKPIPADSGSSSTASQSTEDLFVRVHVTKRSVYENEGFLVTFKLYSKVNFGGFENVKFPEFEGFIAQEIDLPTESQWVLESYNGSNYRTAVLKQTILFPQRSGKLTIGQGKFDVNIRVQSQQRSRSFFDDFLGGYSVVQRTLVSSPVTIDVKSLPAGKPAGFSGAVGNYKMTSEINTQELKANEAVTIKLTINGSGNIKMVKNPEVVFPNDFDVFDPVVNVHSRANTAGVNGNKTIEYSAIPRYAGDFTIPPIQFSYFDVSTGSYKTLTTEAYRLKVAPGEGGEGTSPTIVSSSNKEDVRFLGQDIRHIKTTGFTFLKNDFFFGTMGYWLWYILPVLLFVILFIIYRKQAAQNANIALMRTKQASKVATKRLKNAAKLLKANQREEFHDELLKAVWGYLGDKLNMDVSALTKDTVRAEMARRGASADLVESFMYILNTAEFARYAPVQGEGEMDNLYNQTVEAINQLEKL